MTSVGNNSVALASYVTDTVPQMVDDGGGVAPSRMDRFSWRGDLLNRLTHAAVSLRQVTEVASGDENPVPRGQVESVSTAITTHRNNLPGHGRGRVPLRRRARMKI